MRKFLLFIFILSLYACRESKPLVRYQIRGFAQGTTYNIVYLSDKELVTKVDVDSLLDSFDNSCSLYKEGSLLRALNASQTDSLDAYLLECIEIATLLSEQSGGLYDITVKPLTSALGFAGDKAADAVNVDSIMTFVGYKKISINKGRLVKLHEGVQIDLNSIAQGYSVDVVSDYFIDKGIKNYLVEIGGEVYCKGQGEKGDWKVGIDKPFDGNFSPGAEYQAIVSLKDKGLATSGNYRKFYTNNQGERVNHTVNPITGKSVISNLMSATVVASSATLADGYATMFMVMGVDRSIEFLNNHKDIDAYLVYGDGEDLKTYMTKGLETSLKAVE